MHDPVKAELPDLIAAALPGDIGEERREQTAEAARDNHQKHSGPGGNHEAKV